MLKFFKMLSIGRVGWLILILSVVILELTALYFQYGMQLQPCVMCIYERVALFGILFAGVLGVILPSNVFFRLLGIMVGLGCSIKGLFLAIKHVDYQVNPSPWNQCSFLPEFPPTIPLDKWFPFMFHPTGSCSEITWSFLGISMAQWIVVVFTFYILLFVILLISQVKSVKPKQRSIFK